MPYPIASLPYPFRQRLRQLLSPTEVLRLQIATGSLNDNKHFHPIQLYHSVADMPYPICTLPYPFRRRLRQLLSPTELLSLQIATGTLKDNKHLLPIQTYHSVSELLIEKQNDDTVGLKWVKNEQIYEHNGSNLFTAIYLCLDNLNELDLSDPVFDYVWLGNIPKLVVLGCTITKHFLTKLSHKLVKVSDLSVYSCSDGQFFKDGEMFSLIFETFPLIEGCDFKYSLVPGWVQHMVEYGKTNLKELCIIDNKPWNLFSFTAAEMHQFVKAQSPEFVLRMMYISVSKVGIIESRVFPFFVPCFKLTSLPANRLSFSIELVIEGENQEQVQHFFALRD
uniref:F-box domain-containing protein n=1 Tax=Panagrellus redivivus TaxID=6233 RepID=A0A7E4ZXQ2_PANRE